jgi:hypothetical protein
MAEPTKKMSTLDKFQTAGVVASLLLGAISLYVSVRSAEYGRQQAEAAREANARASGRLPARLVLEASVPDSDTLPRELRRPIFGTGLTTFYADAPEKLVGLNYRVVLRNVGDEPVEAVRLTVAYDRGFAERDRFQLVTADPLSGPVITEQLHREEHMLDQKVAKNEVIILPVTKGLLHQVLQGQRGQPPDAERYGEFVVRCYARAVGGAGFDGLADDKLLRVRLLWLPKGFNDEKVGKLIDGFKPRVEIMKAAAGR